MRSIIFRRLREPSTLAGIAALLAMFGLPQGVPELASQALAACAGIAAVLLPEGASRD